MTVGELIGELAKMPENLPVIIEGYAPGIESANCAYTPQMVEGLEDGEGRRIVAIWAVLAVT